MNTTPIPEHYRKDGFDYRLIRLDFAGRYIVAMYQQAKEGHVVAYEVVRARYRKETRTPYGVVYPGGFKLPNNERWGTDGWTYTSMQAAERKMEYVKTKCEDDSKEHSRGVRRPERQEHVAV